LTIDTEGQPALFAAADECSAKKQREHLRLTGASLISLLIAAVAGTWSWEVGGRNFDVMAAISAAAFLLALVVTLLQRGRRPERQWFDARALAESAKTTAWRYMMGVPPFNGPDADTVATDRMRELVEEVKDLDDAIVPAHASGEQVTKEMRETRNRPLAERDATYRSERLEDQQAWYTGEAQKNERLQNRWSWILAGAQLTALLLAVARVAGLIHFDGLAIAAALLAGGAAWVQVKRYAELSRAYSYAALELSAVPRAPATSEDDLHEIVEATEGAISREHTMWVARRRWDVGRPGV
jgi:hypothetical protein